ncbi:MULTISPECIES: hypothetical protein [Paracoccus]|uniref:hypothetical protein n=1 Tax=Paracoccus TaxID=265 RepID=UPI0008EC0AB1|nr:hypothetical protein [Paracoccus pantotrophus]MDF3856178.1 hypothetical protein [Paracoccus pantotrophus]SFO85592.1 hypothetical protein SAMN04244567_03268 [Paracoccus pantotrophus]
MTAAERTARRLANAATLATAFAEGRFRKVTVQEAWGLGWDAEADEPEIFTEGGLHAILSADRTEIQMMADDEGECWTIQIASGEFCPA